MEKDVIFISDPSTVILPPAYVRVNLTGENDTTPSIAVAVRSFLLSIVNVCCTGWVCDCMV